MGINVNDSMISNINNPRVVKDVSSKQLIQDAKSIDTVSSMSRGDVIRGEIISRSDSYIQLAVGDNILQANVGDDVNLDIGQKLFLQLVGKSDSHISLRPLLENVASGDNLYKALDLAGIKVSDSSLAMVDSLISNGMPIDKNSILSMYKNVLDNPDIRPSSVVGLSKMQVPLNVNNAISYESYIESNHQLSNLLDNVIDMTGDVINNLLSKGDEANAINLLRGFVDIAIKGNEINIAEFTNDMSIQDTIMSENNHTVINNTSTNSSINYSQGNILNTLSSLIDNIDMLKSYNIAEESIKAPVLDKVEATLLPEVESEANSKTVAMGAESSMGIMSGNDGNVSRLTLTDIANAIKIDKGTSQADIINYIKTQIVKIVNSDMDNNSLTDLSKILRQSQSLPKEISRLLVSDIVIKSVKQTISKEWFFDANRIPEDGEVEKYYQNLKNNSESLGRILENIGLKDSILAGANKQLNSSIDFMNDLSRHYAYVQLPVRFGQEHSHSELYVYADKSAIACEDGKSSALLHLDMDNIGSTDIYVSLENERATTTFYLERDEYIDYISKNISLLNERLAKRGYELKSRVTSRSNIGDEGMAKSNPVSDIIKVAKGGSMVSFDVRA